MRSNSAGRFDRSSSRSPVAQNGFNHPFTPDKMSGRYVGNGSPKSDFSANSEMLDIKINRKKAEAELQQLANRVALLKIEEQKAFEKVNETKSRAAEIMA